MSQLLIRQIPHSISLIQLIELLIQYSFDQLNMFVAIEVLILGTLFCWMFLRTHQFLTAVQAEAINGGLSRRKFQLQRPFRPKYQFRYHWLKSQMRKKKSKMAGRQKTFDFVRLRRPTEKKLLLRRSSSRWNLQRSRHLRFWSLRRR